VVGWALDRTLAARLPIAALEQAIAQRQPPPGLVHHSDRGVHPPATNEVGMEAAADARPVHRSTWMAS
jgi:putative transposase